MRFPILQILMLGAALPFSYFWIRTIIWMTPDSIIGLSTPRFDFNESTAKNLAAQKADACVAFIFFIIMYLAQASLQFFSSGFNDFRGWGIYELLGLILFIVLSWFVGKKLSSWLENSLYKAVMKKFTEDQQKQIEEERKRSRG